MMGKGREDGKNGIQAEKKMEEEKKQASKHAEFCKEVISRLANGKLPPGEERKARDNEKRKV